MYCLQPPCRKMTLKVSFCTTTTNTLLGKKSKNVFDFLSSGLGINVSLFRLGQFEEVESELGSPEAGVEIGTG